MTLEEEIVWLQYKYALNAALGAIQPRVSPQSGWQNAWSIFDAKKREPTETEKAIHRAMSFDGGDGKRYGHRPFVGEDE